MRNPVLRAFAPLFLSKTEIVQNIRKGGFRHA